MDTEQSSHPVTGVPKQAFEQFLKALEEKGASPDVVSRLRKTLIDHGDVSDAAIRAALFPNNGTKV
jgi:hypothetical protein